MVFFDGDDDAFEFPDDQQELMQFRIQEPLIQQPYWFGNEIVIEDGYGELRSYTLEEWHEILLLDGPTLEFYFNMGHIDLIMEMQSEGFWDAEDWEEWRDAYASVYGV